MIKSLYLWALLLILCNGKAITQTADHPHGIATIAVFNNYQWPLKTVDALRIADFNSGFEFEYYRFLNEQLNISFPLRISNGLLVVNENGSTYKAGSIGLDFLLNLKLIKEGWFRPHLFAGGGVFVEDIKEFSVSIPAGIGFNFQIGTNSFVTTTAAYKLGLKDFRNHLQIGAGLRFNIAPRNKKEEELAEQEMDKDGDGVLDKEDLCPEIPGIAAMNGCPDTDEDGVSDKSDQCPDTPGLKMLNGCPDSDNDGLIDKEDDCPYKAGPVSQSGCPYDGVPEVAEMNSAESNYPKKEDLNDSAVAENEMKDSQIEMNSPLLNSNNNRRSTTSPTFKDRDGDGVSDKDDRCPEEKGTVESSGCPEVPILDKKILINAVQAIEFETGSAIIKKNSYAILDNVAAVMYRNTAYKLRIEGHTDSVGSRNDNQILSERRALACYNYLLTKGVARSRMNYSGFGESKPIDDNHYTAGREQNRRVEFGLFIE